MPKIIDIIKKYKKVFPEDYFLKGVKINLLSKTKNYDNKFLNRFSNHLDYYQNNLLLLPFEQLLKASNFLFYSLISNKKITEADKKIIYKFIRNYLENKTNNLPEKFALEFFQKVKKIYAKIDGQFQGLNIKNKGKFEFSNFIKDFREWEKNIYGLEILDKKLILKEANQFKTRKIQLSSYFKVDKKIFLEKFLNFFQDKTEVDLTQISILKTPNYLKPVAPTASAYFVNLLSNKPKFFVFISYDKIKNPAIFLFTLFHEIFGHILHFQLINKNCKDPTKKLPYLSRFPLTEGFALLGEDYLLSEFKKKITQNYFQKLLGGNILRDIVYVYKYFRLLRYIRYIFEIEVYLENVDPFSSAHKLSKIFGFDEDSLKEDLLSFLVTPGYGSTYIGGYKMLKNFGSYDDKNFREGISKLGFEFIDSIK